MLPAQSPAARQGEQVGPGESLWTARPRGRRPFLLSFLKNFIHSGIGKYLHGVKNLERRMFGDK